jgi:hypothetical protein
MRQLREDTSTAPGPVPAPATVGQRRLRLGHAAAGVAMVALGALSSVWLVIAASPQGQYLAVARDVEFAQQITAADLVTVRINDPAGLAPVAAADRDRVVGAYAAVPLRAGGLLTAAQLTADAIPGPGQHVVGVSLQGDRLPAHRPTPGQRVLLVATGGGEVDATAAPTWPALVIGVSGGGGGLLQGGRSETFTVDVAVPAGVGPAVARAAAAEQLVVVLDGG